MSKINSKRKGKAGELELAKILRDMGFADARRTNQFCGSEGSSDVVGIPGLHIECKRNERLNIEAAMLQAITDSGGGGHAAIPTVFHRKNGTEWLVTVRLEDLTLLAGHIVEYFSKQGE